MEETTSPGAQTLIDHFEVLRANNTSNSAQDLLSWIAPTKFPEISYGFIILAAHTRGS